MGLWTDISARLFKLPNFDSLHVEMLGGGRCIFKEKKFESEGLNIDNVLDITMSLHRFYSLLISNFYSIYVTKTLFVLPK